MLDNSTDNDHFSNDNDVISLGTTFSNLTADTITPSPQQLEISPLLAQVTVANVNQEAIDNDFNGDGTSDLLWRQATTGETQAWLLNSSGKRQSSLNYGSVTGWDIEQTGDFNGDGISDLLWRQTTTGATGAWLLNSSGKRQSSVNHGSVTGWDIEQTGDFNGDGISDLLWRQTTTGETQAWLLNSSGKRQSSVNYGSVTGWDIEQTGDFNGDGISDLLWRQATTGATGAWLLNSSGKRQSSVNYGSVPDWGIQPESKLEITVTSPNGGNQLEVGKNYNLTWADNISENVRLDLYQGNTLKPEVLNLEIKLYISRYNVPGHSKFTKKNLIF
jgi:hypothetical protein